VPGTTVSPTTISEWRRFECFPRHRDKFVAFVELLQVRAHRTLLLEAYELARAEQDAVRGTGAAGQPPAPVVIAGPLPRPWVRRIAFAAVSGAAGVALTIGGYALYEWSSESGERVIVSGTGDPPPPDSACAKVVAPTASVYRTPDMSVLLRTKYSGDQVHLVAGVPPVDLNNRHLVAIELADPNDGVGWVHDLDMTPVSC
jgi:hypothetical protein